jgi:hypothetical protein
LTNSGEVYAWGRNKFWQIGKKWWKWTSINTN